MPGRLVRELHHFPTPRLNFDSTHLQGDDSMKYSGIAVFLIGVCILLFCLVASVTTGPDIDGRINLLFPVIMGVLALAIGAVMYLYGGRGYISTRNPAIRN
jgi:hypothetical protein